MGFTLMVVLVIAVIATVIGLDLLGASWVLRRLWRSGRARRLEHSIADSVRRLLRMHPRSGDHRR